MFDTIAAIVAAFWLGLVAVILLEDYKKRRR